MLRGGVAPARIIGAVALHRREPARRLEHAGSGRQRGPGPAHRDAGAHRRGQHPPPISRAASRWRRMPPAAPMPATTPRGRDARDGRDATSAATLTSATAPRCPRPPRRPPRIRGPEAPRRGVRLRPRRRSRSSTDLSIDIAPAITSRSSARAASASPASPGCWPECSRPTAGEILLDGVPMARYPAAALTRLRVLIPQEAYVFAGTLAENILYLRGTADPLPRARTRCRRRRARPQSPGVTAGRIPRGHRPGRPFRG